jgi:hypothetical protein
VTVLTGLIDRLAAGGVAASSGGPRKRRRDHGGEDHGGEVFLSPPKMRVRPFVRVFDARPRIGGNTRPLSREGGCGTMPVSQRASRERDSGKRNSLIGSVSGKGGD